VPADLFAARDQDRQDLQLGILPKEVYTQRYVN
jgi:hypothetical protein